MDYRPKVDTPFRKETPADWVNLGLTTRWFRTVNTWFYMECQPDYEEEIVVSEGIVYWWYSPSKQHFTPFFPFEHKRPLLGVKDWIYMGNSVNGDINWTQGDIYYEDEC